MNNINKISIKEFREKGYLQELNRRFLHPLGLAMEVDVLENGTEIFGGIWDYRNEESGIYYNISDSNTERINRFKINENFIDSEFERRINIREKILGFGIEPIKL